MPALPSPLRRQLENAVRRARKIAESGARKSLEALAIHEPDPYSHMDEAQRRLRRRLRAQAKQLGDGESQTRRGSYEIRALVEKTAYDQWHRLLFARFLLENNLLISPDHGVSVSLEDCEELAPSLGLKDAWSVAARFAAVELPEIFRADDPAGAVDLPVEDRNQLIAIVTDLPTDVFTANDSLGWCYQFWQAERKDQVNAAGNKIGAAELPSVTQLFTEDYMVDFLLDNTLGAWWAGKTLAAHPSLAESAANEDDLRKAVSLPGCPWKYLRFVAKEVAKEVAREVATPEEVARPSRSGSPEPVDTTRQEEVARPSRSGSPEPVDTTRQVEVATPEEVARPSRSGIRSTPDRDGLATPHSTATSHSTATPASPAGIRITSGENLPHWTRDHSIYHIAFRLADSVPQSKREEWIREREAIADSAKRESRELTADEDERIRFLYSERIEKFLDSGHGECLLRQPDIADLVAAAIRHFDGQRYSLHAWCVMPNHVHVIVEPWPDHDLAKIIHSWKSFSAHEINKRLGRTGDVWQHDAYNHIIRSENEYRFQLAYVWENPDKAKLPNWKWRAIAEEVATPEEVARPSRSGIRSTPDRDGLATPFAPEPDRDGLATSSSGPTVQVWSPAAGTFDGWPTAAADLKCLDPCMGSGHFIVAMFERLVALRIAEESLDESDAVAAVIRDNLFGLEIDPRCTQIAAFNLALAAWRLSGHCKLPAMNLACSGLAPNARREDWLKLTEDAPHLRFQMGALYDLFEKAPILGSLINPHADKAITYDNAFHELQPLLEKALAKESKDDSTHEMAVAAQGIAEAAEILAGQFTLVATNVPYLGRGKQDDVLQDYCERVYPEAKADLATCFLQRCTEFSQKGGSSALVTPQYWLFQGSYDDLREVVLDDVSLNALGILGPRCFETISGEVVNAVLIACTNSTPNSRTHFFGIDASRDSNPTTKANTMMEAVCQLLIQLEQKKHPDCRISAARPSNLPTLSAYAEVFVGFQNGDTPRWVNSFWEQFAIRNGWEAFHATPEKTGSFEGLDSILRWENGSGELSRSEGCYVKGREAWGRSGVLCRQTQPWPTSLYVGTLYDQSSSVLIPKSSKFFSPIYCFLQSENFRNGMLGIANTMKFTNSTFVKVPFDLDHWQKVAAEKYPDGLPKPFSNDPTQWLFNGHPAGADHPLHVAVARLLGYQWPRQTGSSFPDCPALGPDGLEALADDDGIVPISAVKGEVAAAERLRELLACAFGSDWSAARQEALLAQVDFAGSSLEDWLRNGFFEQHCKLFHHRPFVWHIWDGLKNGFSALVNYHKLTHANLEKLTYAYLGDWIRRQQTAVEAGEAGSDARLQAARHLQAMLKLILEGEPPHDIFVRWKPLAQQSIGWHPDLNDGVRMNIRPFMATDLPGGKKGAGLLRSKPNIKWEKDRGKEPQRPRTDFPWFWQGSTFTGDRLNDIHLTREQKQSARNASK